MLDLEFSAQLPCGLGDRWEVPEHGDQRERGVHDLIQLVELVLLVLHDLRRTSGSKQTDVSTSWRLAAQHRFHR